MANALSELFTEQANAIREGLGDIGRIKPADFPARTREIVSLISSGGGSSDDVRYVTFMSDDGTVEYGKLPVATGYDCPNPKFAVTKESTAQYDYSFYGWATTPNGAADANWNKAVTEDRTVYANFAAVVRYYTITYLDTDGSVLKAESLAYGSMPSYKPTKDGVIFDTWEPALSTVAGNMSYTVKWVEKVTFADSTWADIARVCEAGQASEYFAVGNTRSISIPGVITCKFVIIGINHDDLADGNGKAGLTIASISAISKYSLTGVSVATLSDGWASSELRSAMNTTGYNKFQSDLKPHMKLVKKLTVGGTTTGNALEESEDKVFSLSATEFFGNGVSYTPNDQGEQYEYYKTASNRKVKSGDIYVSHDTRSRSSYYNGRVIIVNTDGSAYAQATMGEKSLIAFCI